MSASRRSDERAAARTAGAGAAFARGAFNRLPILIGFNRDEWWGFEHGLVPLSAAGLQQQFVTNFHDRAAAVSARLGDAMIAR